MSVATTYKGEPAARRAVSIDPFVVVLSLLVAVGFVAGVYRLAMGLGPTTALTDGYPWGIWISFDFSLIAFAGAGFTLAALVYVLGMEKYRDALRPALLAGLIGYTAVLMILALDLGRWDRFYHFLVYWNVHSPLFEISWCVLLYSTVLFVETSPMLAEKMAKQRLARIVHKVVIPLVIIGLTLSTLHQSTLGTLYLNMPHRLQAMWYSPILSLLFFVSSIMAGLSMAMITYMIANRMRRRSAKPEVLSGLAKGVAWVALVYVVLKLGDLMLAGEMAALFAFDSMSWLMLMELGLFAILPMVLFFIPSLRSRRSVQWGGALLVLLGVMLNRFSATLFAQIVPEGASYTPHLLEWLTTIGILSAAVLAWYLAVRHLPMFEDDPLVGPQGH